jgi:hypothetical protein
MNLSRHLRLVAASSFGFALACAAYAGCSASDDPRAAASGSGGSNAGGNGAGGAGFDLDAGKDDGFDKDSACVGTRAEANLVALDIVVLLDKSGSMLQDGKWDTVTAALEDFVTEPASAGISVGVGFFPIENVFEECNYQDYSGLFVPVGKLPQHAPLLVAAINTTAPGGNTPMFAALKGTLLYTSGYQDQHPKDKVVLVFASDGLPGSCAGTENEIPTIANVVKAAHDYNGVETYVIAIEGTDVPSLDLLAEAGGTQKAYDVTTDASQFSAKMAEIRGAALPCEFDIPPPPNGKELDPGRVNVDYTKSGEATPQTIPNVDNLADCGTEPGWYYGPGDPPSQIVLCPASCEAAQSNAGAILEVSYGCVTVLK